MRFDPWGTFCRTNDILLLLKFRTLNFFGVKEFFLRFAMKATQASSDGVKEL